jgi:hypothetical protein
MYVCSLTALYGSGLDPASDTELRAFEPTMAAVKFRSPNGL